MLYILFKPYNVLQFFSLNINNDSNTERLTELNECDKNGHNLGVAFVDLPQVPLFPTVGLQTPGEELEANFGIKPFCYDIEQDIFKLRNKVTTSINLFPVNHTEWQPMIHNLVQSWLIHNGYCSTAQVFSEYTQIPFVENIQNVKQRLKIQQLVLSGKIGEAIQTTNRLYPTVLQDDHNLLFALKCRQFIEFVCGNDDLPFSANGNDCNGNSEIKMDLDINSDDNEDLPSNFPNQLEDNSVHNNNDVNQTEESKSKGHLVQQLMATKTELEGQIKDSNHLDSNNSNKQPMINDTNQLKNQIQSLCQSIGTLTKAMNYLHEDVEPMLDELTKWKTEYETNNKIIMKIRSEMNNDLEPLRKELEQIERQCDDFSEQIRITKSNVFRNEQIITKLINSV
mgnify:CR=1 FL=1